MRIGVLIGLILFTDIIQIGFAPHLLLWRVEPDLLLILVVLVGLFWGSEQGAMAGLLGGLLLDLMGGRLIGFHAFSKFIIGYVAGFISRRMFREHLIVPVVASFVATLVNESISYLLLWTFSARLPLSSLIDLVMPLGLYNALLSPFAYGLMARWLKGFQSASFGSKFEG